MKQQSQTIFWLLLAATAAVSVVATVWMLAAGPLSYAAFLFDALITGALAIVCLWSVFSARRALVAWMANVAAVLVAAELSVLLVRFSFGESLGIYGSFVATLAMVAWSLRRTRVWERWTGNARPSWQFSVIHLLAAMTLVAVLIVSLRYSEFAFLPAELWKLVAFLTVFDVLVVLSTLVLWASPGNWPSRLAAVCAAAGALGGIAAGYESWYLRGQNSPTNFGRDLISYVAYAIIISLVLYAWLELVPIVPHVRKVRDPML